MNEVNNTLITLSTQKLGWKKGCIPNYFDMVPNSFLRTLLKNEKNKLIEFLKKYKYIYLYHRYSDVSHFILSNKNELNQIVIIHDPSHCQYSKWEREKADMISCWCTQYIKNKIYDSHNKLFFMKLPLNNSYFNLNEDDIKIKNIDEHIKNEKYILSIGNTHRDYNILVNALENINIKCYILTNNKVITNNPNIIVKTTNHELTLKYIKYSLFGIIPMSQTKTNQAHGVTVACELSAMKKPFIITENCGINDYLMNGIFGLSYKEKNVDDLNDKIKYLLDENNLNNYKKNIENFYKENPIYLTEQDFINTFYEKCKESII